MLMLIFRLGEDRYALETSQVVEIVPSLVLRKLPHAPDHLAGVFNYRGSIVPVIDLRRIMQDRPCESCLSTRILLVRLAGGEGPSRIVGLRAERMTETLKVSDGDLVDPGIALKEAPYLGKIINDPQGMIQCIRMEDILPRSTMDRLSPETGVRP
ncbi:MAG TPA: chemotaxis protein CheW [Acidobacteriota bacterium]|nr:chemotaxis protein CheW [Acidobacteriota bacterium]